MLLKIRKPFQNLIDHRNPYSSNFLVEGLETGTDQKPILFYDTADSGSCGKFGAVACCRQGQTPSA